MKVKASLFLLLVVAALAAVGYQASAQQQPPGGRGGPGGFDPAQMRQRMMDRYKEMLGSSEDEWKVLQPKIENVTKLRDDSRGGGFGGFGGRGGPGGRGGRGDSKDNSTADQNPVSKASSELRTALDDKATTAEVISTKLASYRKARETAKEALTKAQKELKELLTMRQEAVLVVNGVLE